MTCELQARRHLLKALSRFPLPGGWQPRSASRHHRETGEETGARITNHSSRHTIRKHTLIKTSLRRHHYVCIYAHSARSKQLPQRLLGFERQEGKPVLVISAGIALESSRVSVE